jgi:hypothetical protein
MGEIGQGWISCSRHTLDLIIDNRFGQNHSRILAQKLAKAFSSHWLSSNHGKEGIALAS